MYPGLALLKKASSISVKEIFICFRN